MTGNDFCQTACNEQDSKPPFTKIENLTALRCRGASDCGKVYCESWVLYLKAREE